MEPLAKCLVSFGFYDLSRTKLIIDHFPTSKYIFECVKEIATHLDSVSSLYFLNHIFNQLDRKDQVVKALRMNDIVATMINYVQKATTVVNTDKNTKEALELTLELLNRIMLIDRQLFPASTTLFVCGLQHLHSICSRMSQERYYDLSEPFEDADCVNNWLLLLNSFVEGQSQRISLQCASFVIQYMPSVVKVSILFLSLSNSFSPF